MFHKFGEIEVAIDRFITITLFDERFGYIMIFYILVLQTLKLSVHEVLFYQSPPMHAILWPWVIWYWHSKTRKIYTPQWVIDSAPITEFEDIDAKSKLFDKEIIYDQPTSSEISWPSSWSPSGNCQKFLDNDENWKEVDEQTLLQTNEKIIEHLAIQSV